MSVTMKKYALNLICLLALLAPTLPAVSAQNPQTPFSAPSQAPPKPGDADFPAPSPSERHAEKVEAIRTGHYDLVLIGDSITHSIGELDGKYQPLKEVWDRHYAPRRAINLGHNGYRTEQILWNLQNGELDFVPSPKVVMLLIGTNNSDDRHFSKVHTAEEILAGTKAIVDLIRQRHPTTKILILRIFPRGGDGETGVSPPAFNSSQQCIETCRRAGELTAQLADGKQVFWLDVNHVFLRLDGTINTDLMWDLLHPSPAGAEAWAQAIEPTLAGLMGDQPLGVQVPRNSALIPVPKLENDSYDWYARHADVLRVKDDINPEVVLIGDSITHFWGGEPKSALANGPKSWESTFGRYRTLNLGFGWDRIQNVLWRLDHGELAGLRPRVIVLHIGTNNTTDTANARKNSAAEIAEGIRAILQRLRAKAPDARIILMAVFPREHRPDHPRRAHIAEINQLLVELGQIPGITFLDLGPKMLQPDGILPSEIMADFCHPTEKGYQIWGDALAPLLAAAIPPPASAQPKSPAPERIALWPNQAPIGDGSFETANVTITIYRPAHPNGAAAVICPGGGYAGLVTGAEGSGIAQWLNAHGITGIVLEYRLPHGRPLVPLLDAQRAIRTVRAKAKQWGCDSARIGIIGFSAGGHLASTAATHFDPGNPASTDPIDRAASRPDFAVLVYPVISMGEMTHGGSKQNLLGPSPSVETVQLFSNERQVTAQTPPTFLAHALDDKAVSPDNSELFYEALQRQNIPSRYLALPSGGHGLDGYQGPMWDAWQSGALLWLASLGLIPAQDAGQPLPTSAAAFDYTPAPPDNPLKGFVTYPGDHPTFPHSLEWDYTACSEVMVGPTNFDWARFENKLEAAASRGCQFCPRFYLEYPGRPTGVPQFLLDQGVALRSWTDTNAPGNPPVINLTPDYEDLRLRAALTRFVQALGARYDGDPRLGFIEIGLLGMWGEWHDGQKNQWFASQNVQREVLDAYQAAFKKTRLVARYPAGPSHARYTDNSRRPLGYHDDSFAWATIHTGRPGDGWFFETLLRQAGVLEKWRSQPIGGEVRPEVWDCLFDEPSCAPKGQEFDACLALTHASWLCDQGAFRPGLTGAPRERAIHAARQLGYELQVTEAALANTANKLGVDLSITNRGVAPFYYDWPVELGVLDLSDSLVAKWGMPWKLTAVQPDQPPVHWQHTVEVRTLPPGSYRLLLRVPNPMASGKPLRFANQSQDRDREGWLTLGMVEIVTIKSP